jgi:hypothetical protein
LVGDCRNERSIFHTPHCSKGTCPAQVSGLR